MIVQCSKCEKKYKIDSGKVTERGVKFTCQNCGNIMVVRKKVEDAKSEGDFTPCRLCGQAATIGLDTDEPICDRCHNIEQEKSVRFMDVAMDDDAGPSPTREIDLSQPDNVTFDSLSGGDFSDSAYSTETLPGEGKDYVSPDQQPLKAAGDPGESTVDFGEIGGGSPIDRFDPSLMKTRTIEENTPPTSKKPDKVEHAKTPPPSPPKSQRADESRAKSPRPAPPPSGSPGSPTPPPKPATHPPEGAGGEKHTQPPKPKSGPKPTESAGASARVKDLTPPPDTAKTEPLTGFADLEPGVPPKPPEAPESSTKQDSAEDTEVKIKEPEAEPETVSPPSRPERVEHSADLTPSPSEGLSEATPPTFTASPEQKRASLFPLVLSILLMLALAIYYFVNYML